MKAIAVTPGEKDSAQIIELDKPEPNDDEILVKILKVGLDGTDHGINDAQYGLAPAGSDFLIIGHESLGVVEKPAGGLANGDLVVATVRRPCPQNCLNCKNGATDMCLTGDYTERGIKGSHGFMRQYYVEKPGYLVNVPPELKDVAVLLEPLSIVEKGISQIHQIQKRLEWKPITALVLGAGPLGLLATMVLRLNGLEVHTLDIIPKDSNKVKIIEETGARYIDGREVELKELPEKLGNIDIIFEATGNSSVALRAMSIIGTNGILCLTGVTGGNRMLEICADCLNMQIVLGNKVIFGTVNANRCHFESGIEHMREFEEKWPRTLEKMITRMVGFEDFKKAFKRGRDDIKVVIEFQK